MQMTEILEKLCLLPGVSGDESAVASEILSLIEDYCEAETDPLGSIIARKKGARSSDKVILFDAHMDEVGLMVTAAAEDGSLLFTTVGGIDPRVLLGRQVLVGEDALPGVIGGKPIHLQDADERKTAVPADKLRIDIGCRNREEALSLAKPGDTVAFLPEFARFGNGAFRGKAIDDRFGCAVLVDLIRSELPVDCTFVFSVQEEATGFGAEAAAFSVRPDIAVAVEATSAADIPGVSGADCACKLGGGAVLSLLDKGALYPQPLTRRCAAIAEQKGIPFQYKTAVAGRNDASAYQKTAGGAEVLAISAPCRYIHSPQCVIREEDMRAVRELLFALLENF